MQSIQQEICVSLCFPCKCFVLILFFPHRSAFHPRCEVVHRLYSMLMLGFDSDIAALMMCMGPRHRAAHHGAHRHCESHQPTDIWHSRDCPLEGKRRPSCCFHLAAHLGIYLRFAAWWCFSSRLSAFHGLSPPMVFYFFSQGIKHLPSLSLLQHFYNRISQTPFLTLTGS